MLVSLLPPAQASLLRPVDALKKGKAEGGARWLDARGVLVTAQIAVALILLAGAGLMIRSADRNVPDALHRKLKVRAAAAGRTLPDYILGEMERLAGRPTRDEMLANPWPEPRQVEDLGHSGDTRRTRLSMIVVDASAWLEFLLQTPVGTRVEARLFRDEDELHVPHLVDVEVVQGLPRLVRTDEVSSARAAEAIEDLTELDLHRHAHLDLVGRAWKLRNNIRAYDAM
jgi:predicted nucleic acid-binding protein